jgi:hypothetical protein
MAPVMNYKKQTSKKKKRIYQKNTIPLPTFNDGTPLQAQHFSGVGRERDQLSDGNVHWVVCVCGWKGSSALVEAVQTADHTSTLNALSNVSPSV